MVNLVNAIKGPAVTFVWKVSQAEFIPERIRQFNAAVRIIISQRIKD